MFYNVTSHPLVHECLDAMKVFNVAHSTGVICFFFVHMYFLQRSLVRLMVADVLCVVFFQLCPNVRDTAQTSVQSWYCIVATKESGQCKN